MSRVASMPATATLPARAAVLDAPVVIGGSAAQPVVVKVEAAVRAGNCAIVAGWAVGEPALALHGEHVQRRALRFPRPDVATHFGLDASQQHGFALVVPLDAATTVAFEATPRDGDGRLHAVLPLDDVATLPAPSLDLLGPALGAAALGLEPFSAAWRRIALRARPVEGGSRAALGWLEAAATLEATGQVIVVGWQAGDPDAVCWLETDAGEVLPLDRVARQTRRDVHAAHGARFGAAALQSGFVAAFDVASPPAWLALRALTPDGLVELARLHSEPLSEDPLRASQWLFGIAPPEGGLEQRFEALDGPVLSRLLARAQAQWPAIPVVRHRCGAAPAEPRVSIIVPLYARYDFVESQMLEWTRDPWIRANAELVYVVDDPAIAEPFRVHAEALHRLYDVPFQWVWGGVNRGFSGANNLGALHATAPLLLFLNSDVFPQSPGWLERLVATLESDASIGAVGPRLTFAEGGLQHAGMRFERLREHGVWINRHPLLGLDPALDPAHVPTDMPAITGACLLLRRVDFDAIGGWDTGFLIGDFEDSDLCLKLRERGRRIVYDPTVQLTHLERQSLAALGESDYRIRVTLWNAFRHQRRWRDLIERTMEAAP